MEEETKYPRATGFLENIEDGACRLTEDEKQDLADAMVRDLMWQENRGYFEERCDHNPREKAFRDHWLKENEPCPGVNAGWGILQDLFINHDRTKPIYRPKYLEKMQPRDRAIVATVIQWLGTNCGWCFLEETLKKCGYTIVDTAIRDKVKSIGVHDLSDMMEKAFKARDNWFQRGKELKDAIVGHEAPVPEKIPCLKTDSDADKLRTLADWLDKQDRENGVSPEKNLVQLDLRRIATRVEALDTMMKEIKNIR